MKASAKDLAVALGTLATASKVNTIAIGSGAKADVDNAIAIGGGSDTAKHGTKQTKTEITGLSYGWSGGDKTGIGDIVSIGSAGYERQLKNLAAGEVSETSTDGINGSQLFGVIKDLTNKSLLRYSADNAKDQTRDGDDVLKQSLVNNRLEILGGADKDKLSDNNIGVNAQDGKIHVKLSKELNDLTSTNVSGVVTNASGIAMGDKKITGLADGTDAHDAVNKGQLDKLGNNTFKLGANNNTETDAQALNKEGGLKFDIQGNNGLTTSATGSTVTVGLDTETKAKIDNAADKDLSNITDAGKNKIKEQITWKAKGTSTETEVSDADKANDTDGTTVGADGTLTLDAGKNLRLKHNTATNTFTYALNKTLTDITSIGGNGTTLTFSDKGADLGGKKLTNLGDGTDAGDAVNKGQLDKLGNNTIKLGSNNNTETDAQALNKDGGLKFDIQGNNGLTASATGSAVTIGLDTDTKAKIDNAADKDLSNITDAGKNKIKEQITWKAKGTSTEAEVSDADKANDTDGTTVGADGTLTLNAGKNLRLKHDTATNTFTYALNKTLTDITSIGGNGTTITFSDKGADLGGKKLTNLGDGTDAGDAVNKGQLDKLGNNIFKLGGNNNTETDAQALNKENGLKFNVQGDGGLVASAKGNTVTLTFDEETKAKLNGSNGKIGNNHISFEGNNGTTDQQNLDKADGMKFAIQGNNGLTTSATGSTVTVGLDTDTKAKIDNAADKDLSNITDAGKNKIKEQITWKAKGTSTEDEVSDADKANDTDGTTVGADGTLTLNAGKNLRLKHDTTTNTFTYALNKTLTDITSIGGNGTTITFSDKGADLGGKKLTNLGDGTDAGDAVNKGQLDKLGNNTFKLGSNNNTETDAQALNKEGGLKFDIQGNNGLTASATGSAVTIGLDTDTKAKIDNAADKDLSNITDAGKNKIKEQITWKAKGTSTEAEVSDADKANDTEGTTVGADGTLTLNAGKNLRLKHDTATNTFTYALNKTLTDITSIGGNGTTITFSDKGADLGGKKLTDLGDGTDAGDAVNKGQLDKLGNNTIKLGANNNTETDAQALNKDGGLKFDIQGNNGLTTTATGSTVTVGLDTDTKAKIDNAADKDLSNITDAGKNKIKEQITWKAKGTSTEEEVSDADKANDTDGTTVGADGTLTLNAGKNLRLKHDNTTNTFTYALNSVLTDIASIGGKGTTITFSDKGIDLGNKKITGVAPGENDNDVVVKSQLDKVQAGATKPLSFSGDNETAGKFDRTLGTEVKILGGVKDNLSDNNIGVVGDANGTLNVKLAKSLNGLSDVNVENADGNKTSITPDGVTITQPAPKDGENAGKVPAPVSLTKDGLNNGGNSITNVKSNLTETTNDQPNPTTKVEKPENIDALKNNVATVGDVLNAGWNLKENNKEKDFVKPYDTVDFVNGVGTTTKVETDNTTSKVSFNVDVGTLEKDNSGKVVSKDAPANANELIKNLNNAKEAVKNLAPNTDPAEKQKALDALAKAEKDVNDAGLNKIATAHNVAEMINSAGFTLKTGAVDNGVNNTEGNLSEGKLITPSSTVIMNAGKNMTVKHGDDGSITYGTKDDVEFNSVTVGKPTSYVDENGKPVTKLADGSFVSADNQPIDKSKVKPVGQVNFTAEGAIKNASNNDSNNMPTTALNMTSSDGKPTQITGVGSVLVKDDIVTNNNGQAGKDTLVNLGTTLDATGNPVSSLTEKQLNSVATVRDLANMGWVVSAQNGYTDTVKNANKVEFKGEGGVMVEGKTVNGVREITVKIKDGEVAKNNDLTAMVNGKPTPVVKVGDQYFNPSDIDPNTGAQKAGSKPITPDQGTTPINNAGSGYVTGDKVANAIQNAGFVVGKQKDALSDGDFKNQDEKINPNDELRFADGKNTVVNLATKEETDPSGNKVTKTIVKVDVTGLPMQYTDENGAPVVKVGDKYYTTDANGNPTKVEVNADKLKAGLVNPSNPNGKGEPIALNNVKSNLDETTNGDNATTSKTAPTNPDGIKNNAATVGDVLNAGWNLKENGNDKDFVKPYDTVDFINGVGTTAVVTTDKGETNKVTFNLNKTTFKKEGDLVKATNDGDYFATAEDVAKLINDNGTNWSITSSATNGGEVVGTKTTKVSNGNTVTMEAGNNIKITQDGGKFTFETKDEVNFNKVQLGKDGPILSGKAKEGNNPAELNVNGAKITGVANGDISPTSTDVVNGGQIYALAKGDNNIKSKDIVEGNNTFRGVIVNDEGKAMLKTYNVQGQTEVVSNSVVEAINNMNEQGIKFFHVNDGKVQPKVETHNDIDSSASGKYATDIGAKSSADNENAIAIGTENIVKAMNAGAVGTENKVEEKATGSYALGSNNVITSSNTFVLGNNVNSKPTESKGVAPIGETVENSVYLGNQTTATGGASQGAGTLHNIQKDGSRGESTTAGALGTVKSATIGGLTYGGFQGATANGAVSVGSAGNERRIQNVAAGEISPTSTDAINGSQLHSVAKGLGNSINNLQGQVNKLGKRVDASVAGAMAVANLLPPYQPGQSAAMAAIGQHKGQAALAVGYAQISDNGKYGVKFSLGADTQGQVSSGVGMSYFW